MDITDILVLKAIGNIVALVGVIYLVCAYLTKGKEF